MVGLGWCASAIAVACVIAGIIFASWCSSSAHQRKESGVLDMQRDPLAYEATVDFKHLTQALLVFTPLLPYFPPPTRC